MKYSILIAFHMNILREMNFYQMGTETIEYLSILWIILYNNEIIFHILQVFRLWNFSIQV